MKPVGFEDLMDVLLLLLTKFWPWLLSGSRGEKVLRLIGDVSYALSTGQRRVIENRLRVVLGSELASHQTKRLTREVFRHRWINREIIWLKKFSRSQVNRGLIDEGVRVEGLKYLVEAVSQGKGAILWESSFGKRMLAKVVLMENGFSICQLHGPEHGGSPTWFGQSVIRKIHRKTEAKLFAEVIDIQYDSLAYLKFLVNRLKQNAVVCIPGLGEAGHKFVPIEFLGGGQHFATGVVNLARRTGASLIPMFCFSKDDGSNHLVLEEPLALNDASECLQESVLRYSTLLQSYIRTHPEQWPRWHKLPWTKKSAEHTPNPERAVIPRQAAGLEN